MVIPNIRSVRKRRGLKRDDLATRLYCSSQHVTALENGRRHPSILMMLRLCRVLECAITDLYVEEEKLT